MLPVSRVLPPAVGANRQEQASEVPSYPSAPVSNVNSESSLSLSNLVSQLTSMQSSNASMAGESFAPGKEERHAQLLLSAPMLQPTGGGNRQEQASEVPSQHLVPTANLGSLSLSQLVSQLTSVQRFDAVDGGNRQEAVQAPAPAGNNMSSWSSLSLPQLVSQLTSMQNSNTATHHVNQLPPNNRQDTSSTGHPLQAVISSIPRNAVLDALANDMQQAPGPAAPVVAQPREDNSDALQALLVLLLRYLLGEIAQR